MPAALPLVRAAALALAGLLPMGAAAEPGTCPELPEGATRLALVTARDMDRAQGRLRLFVRDRPGAPWRAFAPPEPASLGRRGLAWGLPYRAAARGGEPLKTEGDGRTPAGFYRIGRSFGFAASPRPGHLVLRPGRTVCVDDPASPAYNSLVPVAEGSPAPRGEDMGAEPLYRRGLVIDYPSDAAARAGSCIFLHVWRGPAAGTAGCVALPEPRVAALQAFSRGGAVIAILPETALARFSGCLPSGEDGSGSARHPPKG